MILVRLDVAPKRDTRLVIHSIAYFVHLFLFVDWDVWRAVNLGDVKVFELYISEIFDVNLI